MCGITGVYHFQDGGGAADGRREIAEQQLAAMKRSIVHRGPDDDGTFISDDRRVGFGFQRLSILDLSERGHQPMQNEDSSVTIMLNGEVYNFKALRAELESKGNNKSSYNFKSESDTESLLHSYEEWGIDAIHKWNGMFAVAIWDERKKKMFLIRDRLGIKPLYYTVIDGTLIFGSEIKAILAHPLVVRRPDKEAIFHYLTFACTPAPYTLFEGIKKMEPGTYLEVNETGVHVHKYWEPLPAKASEQKNYSEEEFGAQVKGILTDSVNLQMVSDVPFGVFLSGGIDSSTNAALMTQARGGKPVDSFSINIKELPRYDEFKWARMVSEQINSNHHEITVGPQDLMDFLPTLAHHADDPNGDPVCFPLYYISKLIRDSGVIVGQVGEGSDELFSGYNHYLLVVDFWKKWWRKLERVPRPLMQLTYQLSKLYGHPGYDLHKEHLRKLGAAEEFFWGGAIAFNEFSKWQILSKDFAREMDGVSSFEIVRKHYQHIDEQRPDTDFLNRMIYLELKIRLPELLLMRVDKMTMANSIEARVPFLDHRLVELALQIPMDMKIKNGNPKHVLKEAVRGIIPDEVIDRKKQGFGAPIQEWLNGPLRKELPEILWRSKIWDANLFNREAVEALVRNHQEGRAEASFKIWNLITLALWWDEWMG
ncbi:asparagine synthase (glutamine-hydrolyzing) [Candidatus Peregrinibacteria bacterium CG11_big_fil_rev_8_21_14_0_20_46_8]|nr:MAG: asparagine synthase (glutamine-hydrolyzing) [Candidatus Peregrinibacteria bacterium CG11_big_fil_rev_8_21_14_0_20_46_8]